MSESITPTKVRHSPRNKSKGRRKSGFTTPSRSWSTCLFVGLQGFVITGKQNGGRRRGVKAPFKSISIAVSLWRRVAQRTLAACVLLLFLLLDLYRQYIYVGRPLLIAPNGAVDNMPDCGGRSEWFAKVALCWLFCAFTILPLVNCSSSVTLIEFSFAPVQSQSAVCVCPSGRVVFQRFKIGVQSEGRTPMPLGCLFVRELWSRDKKIYYMTCFYGLLSSVFVFVWHGRGWWLVMVAMQNEWRILMNKVEKPQRCHIIYQSSTRNLW